MLTRAGFMREAFFNFATHATEALSNTTNFDLTTRMTSTTTTNNNEIFFWRISEPHGCLSQWHSSPFTDRTTSITYINAEQYMMHQKALLFGDTDTAAEILATEDPRDIKALGRIVKGFDDRVWVSRRFDIVVAGNMLKFGQDEELRRSLLETGDALLVEASPLDRIWGVGFDQKKAESNRQRWGLNLLGKALMQVRSHYASLE